MKQNLIPTSISIDPGLYKAAKKEAIDRDVSLSALLSTALKKEIGYND